VMVYAPVVVPGFPTPWPLPPELVPPQPSAAAITTNSRSARGENSSLRCFGMTNNSEMQASATGPAATIQPCPEGPPAGDVWNEPACAAVEVTVIVALPVVEDVVNVMVCGAVKFWPGRPKLQVGKLTAFIGSALTAQLRITEPTNEFPAVTVMSCDADCPGDAIVMADVLEAGERLIPGVPTVMVTPVDVEVA